MNSNKLKPFLYFSVNGNQLTTDPYVMIFETRNPTPQDVNYPQQKQWLNTTNNKLWVLTSFNNTTGTLLADWTDVSSAVADVNSLTGDDLVPVTPVNNNIDLIGSATGAFETASGGSGIMEGSVRVDGVTVTINGNNQLVASGGGGGLPTAFTTFVPELQFGGVAATGLVAQPCTMEYYRFANIVYFHVSLFLSNYSFPLPVGFAELTIPIPYDPSLTTIPTFSITAQNALEPTTIGGQTSIGAWAFGGGAGYDFIQMGWTAIDPATGQTTLQFFSDASFSAGTDITISGFYFCDPAAP